MIVHFNKNLSGSKYQSDSIIQETSRKTKGKRGKTSRSRKSRRIGSQKNNKWKKSEKSSKVLGVMKGVYGRT